jgi:hypothetical protein
MEAVLRRGRDRITMHYQYNAGRRIILDPKIVHNAVDLNQ